MMAPSNPTPLVIFALIAMVICGLFGVMLGQDPFGPGQEVRAEQARTQLAMEVRSTEIAIGALETPQAVAVQHTLEAANLTAMPAQLTATQLAAQGTVEASQIQATQTAIAGEMINRELAVRATQTALIWNQEMPAREQARDITVLVAGSILALVLSGWIMARAFAQIVHARAQEKMAQAQFLAEQRRMAALRASLQNHNGRKSHRKVPNSLMKKTGDIDRLSKTE